MAVNTLSNKAQNKPPKKTLNKIFRPKPFLWTTQSPKQVPTTGPLVCADLYII